MTDIATVNLADPAWFLHTFDAPKNEARLIRVDRQALAREPFLDARWNREAFERVGVPAADLQTPATPPKLNFIWHTAFCGSTALAACLDSPGRNLSLREPLSLTRLAAIARAGDADKARGLLAPTLAMLARRFDPDEQILVKPSNFANRLAAEAMAASDGRMILMTSAPLAFLASVADKGAEGEAFARDLLAGVTMDMAGSRVMSPYADADPLLQAAIAWRIQRRALEGVAAKFGTRAAILDVADFQADPARTIRAAADFLGLGFGDPEVEAALAGPLQRDSKTGGAFARAERTAYDPRLRAYVDQAEAFIRDPAPPIRPLL